MRGRIESGQQVRITPCSPDEPRAGDVVFIRWKGNYLLHLVQDATPIQLLIGNNIGKTNGWIDRSDALGIAYPVEAKDSPVF